MKIKSRDSYLLRKYGITEKDYEEMLTNQKGVCKICERPPGKVRLHVDHDHSLIKVKIITEKVNGVWLARTEHQPKRPKLYFEGSGSTKSEAIRKVRKSLLKCSVRGLLSWHCNTLLQKAKDNPTILANAAKYLQQYEQKYH